MQAQPMNPAQEQKSADMQLLSDAITALNISRHKSEIYPQGHPEIDAALNRAFDALEKLFEKRGQITLAAAKDILHVDENPLDKNHPVYRDIALCLSSKSIASVTFACGLTKNELGTFQRLLLLDTGDASTEDVEGKFNQHNLSHIKTEFIDYEAFSFAEGKLQDDNLKRGLWVRYVQELIRGNLRSSKYPVIREIPPETFARLINAADTAQITDEASDRVMTAYLWQTLEKVSWITDINKLMKFINRLRPSLKKQFLTSSFRNFPKEIVLTEETLKEINTEEALDFLDSINEKKVAIPEAIKNLIEKLSTLTPEGFQGRAAGKELIIDDIPLPYDFTPLTGEDDFKHFVTDSYTAELQALLTFATEDTTPATVYKGAKEWDDETVEKHFNQILLELIASSSNNSIIEQDYGYFNNLLKEQIEYFIGTGQYDQVLKIFLILKSRGDQSDTRSADTDVIPQEALVSLVDSFIIFGGQHREDALQLCKYCGNRIVSPLMDGLINENSRKVRKLLLDMLIHIADEAVPEAIKRLDDTRWYVKRNMLFVLSESSSREALPYVRPYCYHENLKLSFQALRYLLKADERYGIEALRRYIRSGTGGKIEMALIIAGAFGITAIVPELIAMIEKAAKRGSDWENKIPVVKALGQIGDPRALPALRAILETRSIFFRDALRKVKEEVSNTLKNYPPDDVRTVIGTILVKKQLTGSGKLNGGQGPVAVLDSNQTQPGASLMDGHEVPHGN
jgi:hypothetical protein